MAKIGTEFELIASGGFIDSQKEIKRVKETGEGLPETVTAYFEIKTYTFIAYPQESENYDWRNPESGSLYHRLKTATDSYPLNSPWEWNFDTEEQYHDYYEKWNKNRAQVEKDLRELLHIEGETSFCLRNVMDEIFAVVTTKRFNNKIDNEEN